MNTSMELSVRPLPLERLTELVVHLTGAGDSTAREAVIGAIDRHGAWGDGLLNVADALVALRHDLDTELHESTLTSN
jgi:hypothetical protein